MTQSFERIFVIGLLVLCAFCQSEAFFKAPFKQSQSSSVRQRHLLLSAETSNLNRQRALNVPGSLANSMTSVNLHSASSSSSNVYRSASSPTLNTADSPALMRETSSLHRQAASTLNAGTTLNVQRQNTLLQRLRPDPERLNSIGKYLKNGAIAVGGTGGFISIVNLFPSKSKEETEEEKSSSGDSIIAVTTTTTTPELSNPIGQDK